MEQKSYGEKILEDLNVKPSMEQKNYGEKILED